MLWSEERFCAGLQASFFHLCLALSASFTPPPTGEGLGIVFLGFVESALLVYSRLTLLQRGGFGGSVVSFPYSASKTAHRATPGRVWFSPPKNKLTPPPKGGGTGYHLLGFVGVALLVHNWVTLAQQGRFAASLVSFPYLAL